MKKFAAFLLALMMILGATVAFGASPSKEDIADTIGEGDIEVVWTDEPDVGDDGSDGSVLQNINNAQANGSALDVLPQEIRDLLPAGFTVVNEIGAMKLQGNLVDLDKAADVKTAIKFDTPYEPGQVVYLAIGIPGEEETEWVLLKGEGNADRNVEFTFDHDTLVKIGTKTFAVMAISEA